MDKEGMAWFRRIAAILIVALIAGCGGGGSGDANSTNGASGSSGSASSSSGSSSSGASSSSSSTSSPPRTYSIGGTVSGLVGGTALVVEMNGNAISLTANGPFGFPTALLNTESYVVTVKTQPVNPAQVCSVANGSGRVASSDVTNVAISCVTTPLTLVASAPINGATNISRTAIPVLDFSATLDTASVFPGSITLSSAAGGQASTFVASGKQVTVTPSSRLSPSTLYTLTTSTLVRGAYGEQLLAPSSVSFKTQDRNWRTSSLLETDAGNAVGYQVAMDSNDNVMAVWQQADGVTTHVWGRRYVVGTGWGTATKLDINGAVIAPQVAVDRAGNAVAVWMEIDGPHYNIWANSYIVGAGWGSATLIEANNDGDAVRLQLSMNGDGNAVAVWSQWDNTTSYTWANRYVTKVGWSTAVQIETMGDIDLPQVSVGPTGDAMVVWTQFDGVRSNIWANRYVPASGWGTATLIETDNAGGATNPQVAVDGSGNVVAVWQQYDSVRSNIWANRYVNGSGWSGAALIETDNQGDAYDPRVAIDANGNAMAVWVQWDGNGSIYSNRYAVGYGWSGATPVEANNGWAYAPRVAMDAAGNATAVWPQVDIARYRIWSNHYVPGTGWDLPGLVEANNSQDAEAPEIAVSANGEAVALWEQWDGARYNIWTNRFE